MQDSSLRERFGELLEIAGQMFWEVDANYRVTYANGLVKRVFGDPEGVLCHEFMAGSAHVCSDCPVKLVLEGQERATSERMRSDKHGRRVWLQHTATPIRDEAGRIAGASELIIDVTSRKQMEDALKESEERYRRLVEQSPDIIFSLDCEGRFSFLNTRVEPFLGRPVRQLLETPLVDHIADQDKARARDILDLQPEAIWDEEVGLIDRQGNERIARIRCSASFNGHGEPTGYDGVIRDRTVRRKLEEELKASRLALVEKIKIIDELYEHIVESKKYKAIEEHTAEVAHELRQPLAIIGGFARRMAKQLDGADQLDLTRFKHYNSIVISEIQRLERILDGLIDFTRRGEVALQQVNPNQLVEYILGVAEGRAREKGIQLAATLGAEVGEIEIDPGRFQQLVLNLVSNAIEASPSGGLVEVATGASIPSDKALRTAKLSSQVFFEMKIRNTGAVIAQEDLQQIFNPFYTTKSRGVGIGLTVSKKIAEDHSGSISVKSDKEGTVFTVWLPLIH